MKFTSWGAAQQVTGSMHLLELDNYKILIDCGLDYEKETNLEENSFFPFRPETIDVVILTHAHIDHSGNLPTLIRMGFGGQILCTSPTADLTELLLIDSVNIFLSKERKRGSRGRNRRKGGGPQPLYLQKHVMDTTERFITLNYNKPFRLNQQAEITFIHAGHLLGAAYVVIDVIEKGINRKIAFTGDVGRSNYPVLVNPAVIPQVDYLVCESTYGGRFHTADKTIEQTLLEVIEETCIKNPGRLIIPAFSIGRTQALVYSLNQIFTKKLLPPVKVFVDSPMANQATGIYRKYHSLLNEDAQGFYHRSGDQFEFDNLSYVQNLQESKEISGYFDPCIIVSSAGMLEGGRIQDHLYNNIQNYYCTILFIGYSSKGTLGHRLLRGDPIVHIRDRELSVYAKIKKTDVLSGHADHKDLVNTVLQQDKNKLKRVFLIHGEPSGMKALSASLTELGYDVAIPEKGEIFDLD